MSRLQERLRRFDEEVGLVDGNTVADQLPHLPETPMPTPVHIALVNLMDHVLGMAKGAAHEGGPGFTALAVAMRTMQKMRGTALEMLATVPEQEVREFLEHLDLMLRGVINAGYELEAGTRSHTSEAGSSPAPGSTSEASDGTEPRGFGSPPGTSEVVSDGAFGHLAPAEGEGSARGGDPDREVDALRTASG